MELNDYLPMFLAEGREHLQNLNIALVRIEQEPGDAEVINEIFRIAHSLKGMSATMGFARMAALTHEMESVMEGLREGSGAIGQEILDALFGCLDTLEKMTDEIEAEGVEQTDPTSLVETLKRLKAGAVGAAAATAAAAVEADAKSERAAKAAPAVASEPSAEVPAPTSAPPAQVIADRENQGLHVLCVTMTLADDVDMPGVRAFIAAHGTEEFGEVLHSEPPIEALEQGELEQLHFHVWIATGHEPAEIEQSLVGFDGIAECVATPLGAQVAAALADAAKAVAESGMGEEADNDSEHDAPEAPAATVTALPDVAAASAAPAAAAEKKQPAKRVQTVRVEAERLDLLMHLMGEMVVQRTRLEGLAASSGVPDLQQAVNDLSRVAQSLQAMVMQVRMVPVESVFMRFPRMVRDLSSKLGKQVDLQIKGEDTELDRTVVEALGDPLVHLVRNALDHGIETPEERASQGKDGTATLAISAEHAGGEVVIRVIEDGRGVNPRGVAKIAAERGLIPAEAVETTTMEEAIELLFQPGFSTAAETTDISGRGVGMDAVRNMVRNLGGDCSITSELGHGTTATIRLPLSLAILPALLVECEGEPYALPLDRVEQTIRVSDYALRSVGGQHAIVLRDQTLPLHDLAAMLGAPPIEMASAAAVVVRAGSERIGLVVARLVGQQELVTRPLPTMTNAQHSMVSGGAVLGDGQIALIVDVDQLVSQTKAA